MEQPARTTFDGYLVALKQSYPGNPTAIAVAKEVADIFRSALATAEEERERLTAATVEQYNAGRASMAGELDVAVRASNDAHRLGNQAMERAIAAEAANARMRSGITNLLDWLDNDTLAIMKDTIRMGITFDQSDCNSLREQIEKARKALHTEEPR